MSINNWWGEDPREIYWMEIRSGTDGLGEYLLAPKRDGAGKESWSYALTSFVRPGDRVFHWHKTESGEAAIIGWSTAAGPIETVTMSWQARGTRGRERGVATTGDAWRVPLMDAVAATSPITRASLNSQRMAVLEVLSKVARVAGKPTYSPFQHYGGRELRAQQGYLTKFPAALVDLLYPEIVLARSVKDREPRPQPTKGQGYLTNAALRGVLEQYAVQDAIKYYEDLGATEITILGKPYDLRVMLDGVVRHIEVKGSMGSEIQSVNLTKGEVDHAHSWQPTDLYVLDSIQVAESSGGIFTAHGGSRRVWAGWQPADGSLRPTQFRHTLPASSTPDA